MLFKIQFISVSLIRMLLISIFVFQKGVFPDLLATSGDYLRVWRAVDTETRLECILNNVSFLFFFHSPRSSNNYPKILRPFCSKSGQKRLHDSHYCTDLSLLMTLY